MRTIWRTALLGGGILGLAVAARSVIGLDSEQIAARMAASDTPAGWAAFTALGALLCAVAVPRQAVAYAAGLGFGLWTGTFLAMLASLLGCALNLAWARAVARDWARRRIGGRLARIERYLVANSFSATLILRLLPVGHNTTLNLLAGAAGVDATRFLAASAIGFVPQTIIFALAGAGTRLDATDELLLAALLFAGSALVGGAMFRRMRPG